eukprot:6001905-Alexandrium_andersonii.AAC.1
MVVTTAASTKSAESPERGHSLGCRSGLPKFRNAMSVFRETMPSMVAMTESPTHNGFGPPTVGSGGA